MNTSTCHPQTAASIQPKSSRLWFALVLGSLSAFGPLSIDMYLPSLPTITEDLNTTASLTQFSLTACLLGLALGQLFIGPLSDVKGRRKPLMAALAVYTAASLLCTVTPSIWILIALRIIQGAAGSAGIVISRAVVRDMYSGTELTKFFVLLMLVNGAAPILAPIVGGQLLRVAPWRGVFVMLGLISALLLLAVRWGLPETLPEPKRHSGGLKGTWSVFPVLLRDKVFIGYALTQGLVTAAMFGYISGSPFLFQEIYGVSSQTFSVIFAVNGLGIILASQMTGRLAGKIGERKLLQAGLGMASAGSLLLLFMLLTDAGMWAVMPPLFLVVSSVGIVSAVCFPLAIQNYGHCAGGASSLLGLFPYVMGAVTAPLVGIGGSHTAIPMGIVIAAAELAAIICYTMLVLRNQKSGRRG